MIHNNLKKLFKDIVEVSLNIKNEYNEIIIEL